MKKTLLLTPIFAIAAAAPAFADMPTGSTFSHGHGWTGGYGMGFGFLGAGMMVLFWGGLIALTVFAVRWLAKNDQGQPDAAEATQSALETLKYRLAKGEIDIDDFEVRRQALES